MLMSVTFGCAYFNQDAIIEILLVINFHLHGLHRFFHNLITHFRT